ncbi:Erythromycin esterase [Maioricimonas rarisocia]|uniref:Erythromycin esterase n=1 Tax=Maioricimonas rarisocia TaxID=2528026 RepID=A0A517ZAN0_9PLAN|nr:erythromycin esterase family protein [Maioricimonas rarisocia]QDU39479.1 Erythromycin esterase [Maioricimonas rarisocia]
MSRMLSSLAVRFQRLLVIGLCCFAPLSAVADEPDVVWLDEAVIPVRTIDPRDEDFSDLMPLVEKIGSARVVALGEQTHGDGAALVAKHRLVRFLHQKMGFDVLAWESGLFDCRQMDAALLAAEATPDVIQSGIFPIWGVSGHVKPVINYAASTIGSGHRLEMAGFDCQFSSGKSDERFPVFVVRFFDRIDPELLSEADRKQLAAVAEGAETDAETTQEFLTSLIERIDEHADKAAKVHSKREIAFTRRILENLRVFDQARRQPRALDPARTNLRDRMMGENLAWLAREYYPDRKIIVWAASFHLMRNAAAVDVVDGSIDYSETVPMGEIAREQLGDDYYSVMFVANRGSSGTPFSPRTRTLETPPAGSLDALLQKKDRPFAFIDLRSLPEEHPLRETMIARPLGYSDMSAAWPDIFDGVFYTETMFPSTLDGELPEPFRTAAPASTDSPVAVALEEFRRIVIGHNLGFDSVFPKSPWEHFDESRVELHSSGAWPRVLGWIETDPSSYREVKGTRVQPGRKVTGATAWPSPVAHAIRTEGYVTLLMLDGVKPEGSATVDSYCSIYCDGDMQGKLHFDVYATAVVTGELTGSITTNSYFNLVVNGIYRGRIVAKTFAMIYLMGGFDGDVELNRSRLYIAGKTKQKDLERITGTGKVFLQSSDLEPGVHQIGDLEVTVGGSDASE